METSAPKRRRTSPRTAVAVQPESTTPTDPFSRPASSPKRPSFASPTKASMERSNPDILRRRESSPKKPRDQQDSPLPASRPTTPDNNEEVSRALTAQLERHSETGSNDAQSRQPGKGNSGSKEEDLRSPARRLGAAAKQTTTAKPNPRPLPPPAPEEDEEILNPFARRGLRRSPVAGVLPQVEVPEPELPPTPEHPDPVVSTPPSGIHHTPSRRPMRSKAALAERPKSSPLKQPPLRPPKPLAPAPIPYEPAMSTSNNQATGLQAAPGTSEARGIPPPDPQAEKKRLRDSLLAKVAELERDLEIASKENERIRQARLSKKEPSPPSNRDEILGVLRRHALPPPQKNEKPDPKTAWVQAALSNPIGFLPFSKPKSTIPTLSSVTAAALEEQPPPVSHHPVSMTAEEALPYLQLFTPLAFASQISMLPPEGNDGRLLQKHVINATSAPPLAGLFSARIEMTVDTNTLAITQLAVPRLEPSATAELQPFIESVVSTPSPSRKEDSLAKEAEDMLRVSSPTRLNVNVLTWGMAEWLRVAVQRARVWCVLEHELGSSSSSGSGSGGSKERLEEMVAKIRVRKKRRRGKRKEHHDDDDDDDGDEDENDGQDDTGAKFGTGELLPHMGRTTMYFHIPLLSSSSSSSSSTVGGKPVEGSNLRVQWKIEFDWTGEAKSNIGVLVGLPGQWHKHDERGRLSGIPGLFQELLTQGGEEQPLTAVRTVVALLAGEQRK
ncbi:hypothetical protein QBC46DRAFT_296015 [Diplogelasinospora grovesii]|uniref:Uncharacterized protein n=1 Tax=Diplogelasinospora grovesii TaxID=303347 RepID=A0AAN6S135_9PEZI|nr:hypothetical protein QBC46DRAFT_296015 [Diplogelasinospora grovesii]